MSKVTETSNQNGPAKGSLSGAGIARAAGIVMAGFVLARLLGLAQDIILADIYGLTRVYDMFLVASRPPETIFYVVAGGALGSAFIPEFVGYFIRGEDARGWRMASSIINAFLILMAVISGLAAIFAPELIHYLLARSYSPEEVAQTAHMMRIMLITPIIFTVSGLLMGVLNARQHFLLPALAPSVYNLGIIFGALVLGPSMGIDGVAWGTVIGAALHLIVQLPGLAALKPEYRPAIDFSDPGFWRVLQLMGPRVLGLAIVQINFWVELTLATGMAEGSVSALRRGFMLMLMPQGVIAQSVAIAVFPTFAAQVAGGEGGNLRRTYSQVLRSVLFLSLPATVGLIALRLPIVQLIYQHLVFTSQDSQAVAWALMFYTLGLVFHSLLEIVTRAFYAMHDTRTPVMVGGGAMLLNIVLCLVLREMIGVPGSLVMGPFGGLALALSISTAIEVVTLMVVLRPRIAQAAGEGKDFHPRELHAGSRRGAEGAEEKMKGIEDSHAGEAPGDSGHGRFSPSGGAMSLREIGSVGRMVVASAVMGGALWLVEPILPGGSWAALAGSTGAAIVVGGALYWGIAWGLGSEEARMLGGQVMARIGRRRIAAASGQE